MDQDRKSVEFETVIDEDGRITIPPNLLEQVDTGRRRKISVRLTSASLTRTLKERGVTEDEIERIGDLQLEPREQVVKFLLTEGAFSDHPAMRKRAARGIPGIKF